MESDPVAGRKPFEWVGGKPCLDFVNTVSWSDGRPFRHERLLTYRDLVDWGREAGALSDDVACALLERAVAHPDEAEQARRRALAVRRTVYAVLSGAVDRRPVNPDAMNAFNRHLADAFRRLTVRAGHDGFVWDWRAGGDLLGMLWPVIWSGAQLMVSPDAACIKRCAKTTCAWLFLDQSRKRNRRWCTMRQCGNQEKARRHYRRWRAGESDARATP